MAKKIEFLNFLSLRGPSIWTYYPVLEVWVDIGDLEECPSNTVPGLYDRLVALLPGLVEHRCSYGERGGFLRRLAEGTWPAHIMEHITLELLTLIGLPGGFGKARETPIRGVYKVVVSAWDEDVTRQALDVARDLLLAAIEDRPFDLDAALAALHEIKDERYLGPSTASIVDAAMIRKIPSIRLSSGSLVQLGYGAARRMIWTAETDRTSAIAEGISRDKDLTKTLLQSCGIPVPTGRTVDSAADAWEAACDLGVPVVIKPEDGNHGRGVFTNLTTQAEIENAYAVAVDEGSGVLIERFIPGVEHRVLVVGDRVAAAARGEEAFVVGDGRSSVLALIESQLNSDPRRGTTENHPLNPVRLDSAARLELARLGLTGESVLTEGQRVLISRHGNVAHDCTALVHPSVAAHCVLAARVVGLDIAGIDLVTPDIGQPLRDVGGAVIEVNAGPGLLMHLKPASGEPAPVGHAIIEHLFGPEETGRIPIVGITGSVHKTATAHLLNHFLRLVGRTVGMASSQGMFVKNRCVAAGDQANRVAANRLLINHNVEVAIIENDSRVILSEGLAYDRCSVGVVTSIDVARHIGPFHIDTPEKVFSVFRTQIDVVLPTGVGVLNADEAMIVDMAELCDGAVLYFTQNPVSPVVAAHRTTGGRAVILDGDTCLFVQGDATIGQLALPATAWPVPALLAALATGWAVDLTIDLMRAGLDTLSDVALPAPRA
ncbi:cyanophycin synthetase [Halothiobacillus diazotrophicus]|uniref:Cyanophycin synthetase n=1 Tax=Halothiobacillus diazotrophicus TaxID=1860122 RepID=A0A191ZFR1_9GAMM|nr:cyanophycin synthetase [Halothiobacillus diazotrophicus]ANJ66695.1 cyanophycin synthetase [Halothiobacillus diazotrophicus]